MNSITSSTPKKEQKKLRNINKDLNKARKVALVQAPKAVRKVVKASSKAKEPVRATHLSRWAKALADPFNSPQAICPVNFNVCPSTMNTTARLTHIDLNVTVPANQTRQITIFPHGELLKSLQDTVSGVSVRIASGMDPVAFHSGIVSDFVTGTNYTAISPFNTISPGGTQTFSGVLCLDNLVGLGACTNGAANAATVRGFDAPLPYAAGSFASHLRAQTVSIGARLYNTTPQLSRGGNVTTVQLANQGGLIKSTGQFAAVQRDLEINPSFRTHGDCGDGMEISWIPRLQDLAYWHNIVSDSNSQTIANIMATGYGGAGMVLFLNNTTASTQSFSLELVWNLMFAGTSVQSISSESVVEPMLRSPIEQTVTHMVNNSSTAKVAPIVARAASTSTSESRTMSEKLAGFDYSNVANVAHTVGKVVGHMVAGYQSYGHARNGGVLVPR